MAEAAAEPLGQVVEGALEVHELDARKPHDRPRAAAAKPWGLLCLLMAMTAIGPTTLNVVVPALPSMARVISTLALLRVQSSN